MNETVLIVLPSGQFLAVDRAKVSHKSRDYCHLYDGHFAVASGPMREALDVREVLAAHCREVPRAGRFFGQEVIIFHSYTCSDVAVLLAAGPGLAASCPQAARNRQ